MSGHPEASSYRQELAGPPPKLPDHFLYVGAPGIEPGLSAPKADVLPLYYAPQSPLILASFSHSDHSFWKTTPRQEGGGRFYLLPERNLISQLP